MDLITLCQQIAKSIALPSEYHIAAIFKDNSNDEILGWCVLDSDNRQVTSLLKTESLEDWKKFILN